jgi:hypothetical protein
MKTVDLKNAAGKVRMTVLASDDGKCAVFASRAAAAVEAAKHANAKPAANNFNSGPHDKFFVRIHRAT